MKAHIPISNVQRKRIEQETRIIAEREIERERTGLTRRLFKVMICGLHEHFGFGEKRCLEALETFTGLIEKSGNDEVYWEHIDRTVIDYLKMPFERDYTDKGKARD